MQAVILAGGKGERLRPLTNEVPKPMILINGKPFLQWQIEMLKRNGIDEIVICSGCLSKYILEFFEYGEKFGVKIRHSVETEPMGTGGALKNAEGFLKDKFILLYGDSYLDVDYASLWSWVQKREEFGTLVVSGCAKAGVKGNVISNRHGLVTEYNKKGSESDMWLVDAGVMVFSKKVLELIPARKFVSLEEETFQKLIDKKELLACMTDERFYDIGTLERLRIIEGVLK